MKFEIKCVNNLVYGNIYIWILKDYIYEIKLCSDLYL